MSQFRSLSTWALAAAITLSLGLAAPAAFAEDVNAPPHKTTKVAAKGSKARGAKSKAKKPANAAPKSEAAPAPPSPDKE
jgi:hypothetical protein